MTTTQKKEIIDKIISLLVQLNEEETPQQTTKAQSVEMLTIKECTDVIQGLSEHTVRQLIAQNKIKYIRTGQGKRGKILVNKADLVDYFNK